MTMEKMNDELAAGEPIPWGAEQTALRRAERAKAAALAEQISLQFLRRRRLLATIDHDPASWRLEAYYAKYPDEKGSLMLEPLRCSFCSCAVRHKPSTLIEGRNAARICGKCAREIVDQLDHGA